MVGAGIALCIVAFVPGGARVPSRVDLSRLPPLDGRQNKTPILNWRAALPAGAAPVGRPPPPEAPAHPVELPPPLATLIPDDPALLATRSLVIDADPLAKRPREAHLYVEGYAAEALDARGRPRAGASPRWRWRHPNRARRWPESVVFKAPARPGDLALAWIDVNHDRRMDPGDSLSAAWSPASRPSPGTAPRRVVIDRSLRDEPGAVAGGAGQGGFAGLR